MKENYRLLLNFISYILLFLVLNNFTFGQISDKIINIDAEPLIENQSISISAKLAPNYYFEKIEIAYRAFGQSEFNRYEMSVAGNSASYVIPAELVTPPYIEYYLIIYLKDTEEEHTYPIENPDENPLKLVITPSETIYNKINWISPEENKSYKIEDLIIAFSLLGVDTTINLPATKVYLNETDITEYSVMSEDLFVIKPENLPNELSEGEYQIQVELTKTDGQSYDIEKRNFRITIPSEITNSEKIFLKYKASAQLETRTEDIAGFSNTYKRGTINANSDYGIWKLAGKLYVTSEEKSDRQPQNRFFIGAETPWIKIGYGDIYPMFPNLIMNGKRIRGVNTNLSYGVFNFDFVYGEINRKIESQAVIIDSSEIGTDPSKIYFRTDQGDWIRLDQRGTFKRNLLVLRPSFGNPNSFLLGFNFLKSKDDVNSIKYGITPQENVVIGSDLYFALDNKRIEFSGQAAISASNKDITNGTIKDEDIDSLNFISESERDFIKDIKNLASKIITINENLVPLSLKNSTTLAYEGAVSLNYFDNFLRFSYLRRGNSCESFGQTYIRTDVQGFNITDRLRLMKNRLFLSLGFEKLQDNTAKIKAATTKYTTFNTSASYYPNFDFPNISIGYTYAAAQNSLQSNLSQAVDDFTNRVFLQLNYNFTFIQRQNIILNISTSKRNDLTSRNFDTKNNSIMVGINTNYEIPLQTSLILSVNGSTYQKYVSNTTIVDNINYTTIALSGSYRLWENKILLNGAIRPSFGDISRGVYELGAQYSILTNLNLICQLSIYKSTRTESVWSLILRFDV